MDDEIEQDVPLPEMSDPFELRLVFSNRLKALKPCDDTADEAVGFALKHRELAEDFHSCIIEQLENVRALSLAVKSDPVGREQHQCPRQHRLLPRGSRRAGQA